MAVVGATPAVVAAFTFGLLTNAATAALFLYYRSHGSSIFRNGLRLVLIIFLLSSALWAQVDFISVLLDVSSSVVPCQIVTIFATIFDQLARFSIEQYLLWAMNSGAAKLSASTLIPQLLILVRFVAGGVFAGFTRAQTDTFCVAVSSVLPVAIVVIVMDVVILLLLVVRAFQTGVVAGMSKGADAHRSKSIVFVLLGFAIWTATSVMMLLGMRSIDVAARTAAPAVGLTILIVAVTASVESLRAPRVSGSRPPEAPSPRRLNISRDISTSDSEYPPSRYEDLKEAAVRSSTSFINPRQAPMFKDETDPGVLPRIARPVTGISGVGGLPVQGELFPPTRPAAAVSVVGSGVAADKKRVFGKSAGGNKLVIGAPVLQSREGQNPLSKMPLMDLREAAQQERDRREKMAESSMAASRSTIRNSQPPNMTLEEGLKRAVSLKRKEVQSMASQVEKFPTSLQPGSAGMTTSAQLSPAVDDLIRRRSPRQLEVPMVLDNSVEVTATSLPRPGSLLPEQAAYSFTTVPTPAPPPVPVPVPVTAAAAAAAVPVRPAPDATIRPSRRLPSPKSPPPPEPTKTPLQRRPTVGLPSNPRSRGMNVDQQASAAAHQTVLFVNKIVYNNPGEVEDIIKGASDRNEKAAFAPAPGSSGTRLSVVNRPRPIPRKAADPQPSPSPKHRRSKSGGSLSRKSILTSMPGSPTLLPPLPDLPKSAGAAFRPQPNDTKSMTFDEKMTIFFPSPPSATVARSNSKRRSSVPEIPRIPISYMAGSSPTETEGALSRRTTIKTDSILDVEEITEMPQPGRRRAPSVADEVGTSWLPGIAPETEDFDKDMRASQRSERSNVAGRRASSPVIPIPPIPPNRDSEMTFGSNGPTTMDDATTAWGSLHSPEVAVPIVMASRIAQPTQVQKPGLAGFGAAKKVGSVNRQTMKKPQPEMQQEPKTLVNEHTAKPQRASQWHHRVGDECPKFSTRMEKTKSRKMPPPTPLLLNGSSTKKPIYVQAEPSPMESPGQALNQIQEQLRKLEQPVENQDNMQRIALLENLEKEMGLQENHWQEMKHDLARDSMSSVQTSSPAVQNSKTDSVATASVHMADSSSVKSSLSERRASRRALMRMSNSSRRTSTQSNDNAQLSNWQKRLTEAQMEYMDTAAKVLRDRGSNYLTTVTTSMTMAQLGSPTPPESEQSDDEEVVEMMTHEPRRVTEIMNVHMQTAPIPVPVAKTAWLWTPAAPEKRSASGLLWSPPAKSSPEPEVQLPSLSVRPAPRKELAPLPIHSTQLWRKPHAAVKRPDGGLWRPVWASAAPPVDPSLLPSASSSGQGSSPSGGGQPSSSSSGSQKAPRPLTQRPPRRNKRMTLLPDILESPKPLPDKRGTLGIFQFPWGEKSDTASVQPTATRIMAMPGTMASGGPSIALEARSRQLEAAEYSSSFFDDYDDDEDEEMVKAVNSSDDDEDDSDDAFDETTLWEIASLLKTDNVPSKDSMFPPMSSSVISDYIDDLASDDESSSREQSIMIGLAEESREHFFDQSPPVAVESTTLWAMEDEQAAKPLKCKGNKGPVSAGLWQHPEVRHEIPSKGLFSLETNRSEFRTTTHKPAAKKMERKPRSTTLEPLETLGSFGLWTRSSVPKKTQPIWTGGVRTLARPRNTSSPKKPRTKSTARKTPIPRDTTEAEWLAALNEAILASYPDSEEAAAVAFASASNVRRSRPVFVTPEFDSATRHPVFAASSLITTSEWFHPAATGYTYDTAIVNPVFFGSLAITCPLEAVHPAMSAYAAKKLRRQRSKSSSVSRSNSGSKRSKDEIRAQLRALEQSDELVAAVPETTDMRFMPETGIPTDPFIQAQIEALEQERLFVERLAQEEYQRRASMYAAQDFAPAVPQEEVVPPMPVINSGVEDLQRRLSLQVRQSLVLGAEKTAPVNKQEQPAIAHVRSGSSSSEGSDDGSSSMMTFSATGKTATSSHSHSNSQASIVSVSFSHSVSPTRKKRHYYYHDDDAANLAVFSGQSLWQLASKKSAQSPKWQTTLPAISSLPRGIQIQGEEDMEALQRRERGRKQIRRMARRNEILAQIAAIEAGTPDAREEMLSHKMWSILSLTSKTEEVSAGENKNWLREVCSLVGRREQQEKESKRLFMAQGHQSKPSRVVLRY